MTEGVSYYEEEEEVSYYEEEEEVPTLKAYFVLYPDYRSRGGPSHGIHTSCVEKIKLIRAIVF